MEAVRNNSESLLKLQNQWFEIWKSQALITKNERGAERFLESISQVQDEWTNFVMEQSGQLKEVVERSMSTEKRIPHVVDFMNSFLRNFFEVQRRWIEMAKVSIIGKGTKYC